ncbi:hypothetical protein [Superficieibacter electus]|uniref:hypothetical protein n=1 Tax=Superficieibacter electus TaxID=2022662 RepID=UPI00159EC6E2|nr:hypothetical protein [Superficieibacter electus]
MIANLSDEGVPFPDGIEIGDSLQVVINNYPGEQVEKTLSPWQAMIIEMVC